MELRKVLDFKAGFHTIKPEFHPVKSPFPLLDFYQHPIFLLSVTQTLADPRIMDHESYQYACSLNGVGR